MITDIIERLNKHIDYSYKDVLKPVAYPVLTKSSILPASLDGEIYNDAVPDSKKKSIAFWEDWGTRAVSVHVRDSTYVSNVRLIVWVNMEFVDLSRGQCISEMIKSIPKFIPGERGIYIKNTEIFPSTTNIFSRYSFREGKQYMTAPYYAFSLAYDIKFKTQVC